MGSVIPAGITQIGEGVFKDCGFLEDIEVAGENGAYVAENAILFNKMKTELICYPVAKTETSWILPKETSLSRVFARSKRISVKWKKNRCPRRQDIRSNTLKTTDLKGTGAGS